MLAPSQHMQPSRIPGKRPLAMKRRSRNSHAARYAHNIDLKEWDQRFFRKQQQPIECSFIDTWRKHDTSGDLLDIFLQELGSQTPSWVAEMVKEYCYGYPAFRSAGRRVHARARVCDTEVTSGLHQAHGDWLTAEQMQSVLQEKVTQAISQHYNSGAKLAKHLDNSIRPSADLRLM